jgi:hypothetical protein
MKRIASIFDSQADAERAVDELDSLGLEEGRIRVMTKEGATRGDSIFTPIADALTPGDDRVSSSFATAGAGEETAEFFSQELDEGGAIVIAEVDDAQEAQALEMLRRAGGRAYERS